MNKSEDIAYMSAYDMFDKIIRQELSSLEITELIIERIEKINPIINAYCTTTFDLAREMAIKADDAIKKGNSIGLLNGIPTSIKDLIATKGIKTTYGSKIYENFIPQVDDIAVHRLKKAGCVILGKTNTPEFGFAGATYNKVFGVTRNPWNLERTSGGSSGGAAASVATGMGPLALGSDGGGSIRHPASFCGIYGLKPTFGRIPIYPRDNVSGELSHYGPLVRYVKDAALMLDVMKGPHYGDKESLLDQKISYSDELERKPNKVKIAFSIDLGYAKEIDAEVEKVVTDSVYKFEELGWVVEPVKTILRPPRIAFQIIYTALYAYNLRRELKEGSSEIDPDLMSLIIAGQTYKSKDLLKAYYKRNKYFERMYRFFLNYDLLITPTTAIPAFELGVMYPPKINGKMVSPLAWQPFTFPFNLTGNPVASIPCGWSKNSLPIGMQIIGKRFDELLVLQASKGFEEIQPWQEKRPKF